MILIDILVLLVAVGAVAAAGVGVRSVYRRRHPELRGGENADEAAARRARRCAFCLKVTKVEEDLFVDKKWYHEDCYRTEGK